MNGYVPDRGDIVWIDFSPQAGHEQANRRPALVLSPRVYNAASGLALVVPISTREKGHRFEVRLPETLNTRGIVISDQVRNFDWRARLPQFEEAADERLVDEIVARIAALLGIS